MQVIHIAAKEAEGRFKFAAMRDARRRDLENAGLYSAAELARGERMKLGLEICYSAYKIHVRPWKTFIGVKVDRPTVRDRRALAALEEQYSLEGVVKVISPQGITYRIPKLDV